MPKCDCGRECRGIAIWYYHDGGVVAVDFTCAECCEAEKESFLRRRATGWTYGYMGSDMCPYPDFYFNSNPNETLLKLKTLISEGNAGNNLFWRIINAQETAA